MATGVATQSTRSDDARARLQIAKIAEQRQREKSILNRFANTWVRRAALGTALMNPTPQFEGYQSSSQETEQANTINLNNQEQSLSLGEKFHQQQRSRIIQNQIGSPVGINPQRQSTDDESSELDEIEQTRDGQYSRLLQENQSGQDRRLASAKRQSLRSVDEKALSEGVQAAGQKVAKEVGGLTTNLIGDAGEALDTSYVDAGLTQFLVLIKYIVQAARTIFSPVKETSGQPTNINDLKAQATESMLDTYFPRFNLYSVSGLSGLLGFVAIPLFIAVGILLVLFIAYLVWSAANDPTNPLYWMLYGFSFSL